MSFKAGDKVKCIDINNVEQWFSARETYIISKVSIDGEHLEFAHTGFALWHSDRFELIEKGEDMQENNALGFKIGDKVKIIRKDDTFGWYDGMEDLLGTEQVITHVGYSGKDCSYLICGWYFPDGALKLIQPKQAERVLCKKKFNPKPGDKIICNNGEEFTCCTKEFLSEKGCAVSPYKDAEVFAYYNNSSNTTTGVEWTYFNSDMKGYYDIREVIPQQKYEAPSKAEPMYSAEDICKAFITDLGWHEYSFGLLMESLEKVKNPEYMEYLRLKAMFETEDE